MSRVVRCSIIQASNTVPATERPAVRKEAMMEKHVSLMRQAAAAGAQIVCLQEIFNEPSFCAEQEVKRYETTEPVPDGPTVKRNIGSFHGVSYFANPSGQIFAQAARDKDEVLTADLNLDEIAEERGTWQFFRDRRPDLYGPLAASRYFSEGCIRWNRTAEAMS